MSQPRTIVIEEIVHGLLWVGITAWFASGAVENDFSFLSLFRTALSLFILGFIIRQIVLRWMGLLEDKHAPD